MIDRNTLKPKFLDAFDANRTQLEIVYALTYNDMLKLGMSPEDAGRQADAHAGERLIQIQSGEVGCAHEDWYNDGLTGAICRHCGKRVRN